MILQSIEDGRKEDGNRSIADKIIKRLHDLDKSVKKNQGRWVWELLQNAKDSVAEDDSKKISVKIILNEDSVEFKHNGSFFTEKDIRGLINQISSKEAEDDHLEPKRTGRFGTGFLTTHLLSKMVKIEGIVKTTEGSFYSFSFPLNRTGKTTNELIPMIENSWSLFHESTRKINSVDKNNYDTIFRYQLDEDIQKRTAQIGLDEFTNLIHFVMTFTHKIQRVDVINNIENKIFSYKNSEVIKDEMIKVVLVEINGEKFEKHILLNSNSRVSIAAEIVFEKSIYQISDLKDVPKLFCDFPLVGSEKFYLPVVVNSFYFNPLTERDGVWLNDDVSDKEVIENKNILIEAINLYGEMMKYLEKGSFCNIYNLAESRLPNIDLDQSWYKNNIQQPIRSLVLNSKIVEQAESQSKKAIKDLLFPKRTYPSEIRDKIWQFCHDLFPKMVCKKEHVHNWIEVSWDEWRVWGYDELVKSIQNMKSIKSLSELLNLNEENTFDWLNLFGQFLTEDESNRHYLKKYAIIPNQNGLFCSESDLYIDKIVDADLVRVLELLGDNWKEMLIDQRIRFGLYHSKEKKDIAIRISEILNTPPNKDTNYVQAIGILSEWFDNNEAKGKEIFLDLYHKKADLFMNTIKDKEGLYQIMKSGVDLSGLAKVAIGLRSSPSILNDLSNLLDEFQVGSLSELRNILENYSDQKKIELTQEILAGLGISSVEELEKALEDKNLKAIFAHTSTPSVRMFVYAQSLIDRAKNNVLNHLKQLPQYDCSEMEELARTVVGGIKKDGLLIQVVIRPSDHGEVIVYYSSEKDTLDYGNAELWIDNGVEQPKHLTLGKILKTTGINRIPV